MIWRLDATRALRKRGGLGEAKIWQVGPGWTRRGGNPQGNRGVKEAGGRARLHARSCRLLLRSQFQ